MNECRDIIVSDTLTGIGRGEVAGYHKKVKSLPNNFADTLPPIKSDLAKAAFKDPYNFGFVDMTKVKQKTDLEDQLTTKITEFLLEFGTGFSFVKSQFPLNIDGDESRVDLLMYHTRLHCYVAIELKVVEFQPEFISKLNYYISAIDDLVKMPEDNPYHRSSSLSFKKQYKGRIRLARDDTAFRCGCLQDKRVN